MVSGAPTSGTTVDAALDSTAETVAETNGKLLTSKLDVLVKAEGGDDNALRFLQEMKTKLIEALNVLNKAVVKITRMHYANLTYEPPDVQKQEEKKKKAKAAKPRTKPKAA